MGRTTLIFAAAGGPTDPGRTRAVIRLAVTHTVLAEEVLTDPPSVRVRGRRFRAPPSPARCRTTRQFGRAGDGDALVDRDR